MQLTAAAVTPPAEHAARRPAGMADAAAVDADVIRACSLAGQRMLKMTSADHLTKEQLVQILDGYLFGWAYKDMERASIEGTAKLAGFILGACFIDAMASFHAGVDRESSKRGSGERFKCFVGEYLKSYDPERLWYDLRCGLVHSYAEGGTYVFTDANKVGFHMNSTPTGKIILNLEDFFADLRQAYAAYRMNILSSNDCFLKAKKRFESMGLMMLVRTDG